MGNLLSTSNLGLLLNFHQSVRLSQISRTNEAILGVQWEQNQTLNKLSAQLTEANNTSKTILENQINQIKKEEEQRLCKSLLFAGFEIVDLISKIENELVRAHFIFALRNKIHVNLEFCKVTLTEFTDLKQVKETWELFNELDNNVNAEIYGSSIFSRLNEVVESSLAEREILHLEQRKLKRQIRTFQVPSSGFLGLNSAANKAATLTLEGMQSRLQLLSTQIGSVETLKKLDELLLEIEREFPEYGKVQSKVTQVEESLFQKLSIDFNTIFADKAVKIPSDLKPLIEKACETVIFNRGGSIQILQRKFGLPYRRAERLLDVLSKLNVLGPFNGTKPRDLLITEGELEEVLLAIED